MQYKSWEDFVTDRKKLGEFPKLLAYFNLELIYNFVVNALVKKSKQPDRNFFPNSNFNIIKSKI